MASPNARCRILFGLLAVPLLIPGCEAPVEGGETIREPVLQFAVGTPGDPARVEFGRIQDLAVGPSGEVVVLDGMSQQLTVIDSTGAVLRTFSRQGRGPGEIAGGTAVEVLSDGTVAVLDARNLRVTLFSPEGEYRSDWPMPVPSPLSGPTSLQVLEGDRIAVALRARYGADGSAIWPRALYEIRTQDGVVVDTVWGAASHAAECGTSHVDFRSGFIEDARSMYRGVVRWTLTTEGNLVIGCSSSTRLTVERVDSTVSILVPRRSPVERTTAEVEWFRSTLRAHNAANPQFAIQPFDIPAVHPPIAGLLPTAAGRFLVVTAHRWRPVPIPEQARRPRGASQIWEREKAGDIMLFDSDEGRYLATIPLPDEAQYRPHLPYAPPVIRGDRLWLVLVDPATGVQSVGAFRIR